MITKQSPFPKCLFSSDVFVACHCPCCGSSLLMTNDQRGVYGLSTLSTTVFPQSPFLPPDVLDKRYLANSPGLHVKRPFSFAYSLPRYIFQPLCSAQCSLRVSKTELKFPMLISAIGKNKTNVRQQNSKQLRDIFQERGRIRAFNLPTHFSLGL